jgi:hypothetical protein
MCPHHLIEGSQNTRNRNLRGNIRNNLTHEGLGGHSPYRICTIEE